MSTDWEADSRFKMTFIECQTLIFCLYLSIKLASKGINHHVDVGILVSKGIDAIS
jgi:hypothetical protein